MPRPQEALGWTCLYVPLEIILAADYRPVRVPLAANAAGPPPLPANLCRPVLEAAAQAASGSLRGLAAVAVADACNPAGFLADALSGAAGAPPVFWVPAPHNARGEAVRYYLQGLRGFARVLGLDLGRRAAQAQLQQAVAECDRVRRAYAALARLRRGRRLAAGMEAVHRVMAELEELAPPEAARALEGLAAQARRSPSAAGRPGPGRPPAPGGPARSAGRSGARELAARVILVANFLPHPRPLVGLVEELGGLVVHEDTCGDGRQWLGTVGPGADPLEALARRYLHRPPCPRAQGVAARLNYIFRLARGFAAQGVLYCLDPGCVTQTYELAALEQALKTGPGPKGPAGGAAMEPPGWSLLALEDAGHPGAQARARLEAWLGLLAGTPGLEGRGALQ